MNLFQKNMKAMNNTLNIIERKYIIGNDTICINLVDIRDSYASNNATREIGNIFIYNEGICIIP